MLTGISNDHSCLPKHGNSASTALCLIIQCFVAKSSILNRLVYCYRVRIIFASPSSQRPQAFKPTVFVFWGPMRQSQCRPGI